MNTELSSLEPRARVHAALGDPARLAMVDALMVGDLSPGEIARRLDLPTNLVAHHVMVLREAGVLVRSRSEADRRRTYLQLVPGVLAGLVKPLLTPAARVVFVCSHNAARSQLAAALWPARSRVPVASAGTEPAKKVHPRAVRVAGRHGMSLAHATTAHVDDVIAPEDLVIAVCDNAHEHLPDAARLHWSVPDPARADTDAAFEAAYTDLASRIDRLAPTLAASSISGADHA